MLDEGEYLCSWRPCTACCARPSEVNAARPGAAAAYAKPELLATGPNQLWSWDITKLKGPTTWSYYYLYVMLDVFSRYVVGWMIAEREVGRTGRGVHRRDLCQGGDWPHQLTLACRSRQCDDRKCVAHLLADLGVTKTHSRPQVSNDNPFSEAQFKTVKYHPAFPERFGSLADARAWARPFFPWYNTAHHHTGIGLLTPATVHRGRAPRVLAARQQVLTAAYAAHPERFVRGRPQPPTLPTAVWINPPAKTPCPSPACRTRERNGQAHRASARSGVKRLHSAAAA